MNIAAACFLVVDFLWAAFPCKLWCCLGLLWPHHLRLLGCNLMLCGSTLQDAIRKRHGYGRCIDDQMHLVIGVGCIVAKCFSKCFSKSSACQCRCLCSQKMDIRLPELRCIVNCCWRWDVQLIQKRLSKQLNKDHTTTLFPIKLNYKHFFQLFQDNLIAQKCKSTNILFYSYILLLVMDWSHRPLWHKLCRANLTNHRGKESKSRPCYLRHDDIPVILKGAPTKS